MEYLIKASAVIALFYLCFYFFLKKETFFNHNRWFLLIGVVIALIFPFIVIPIHIAVEPMIVPETVYTVSENIPVNIQKPIPVSKFEWLTLLPIIYGIGLIVFLTQFIFQFGSLILLLLKNPSNKDGIYTYVIVNNTISPFSFFKWIVYNPESFNNEELKLMLTHEKVHANQLHSIDILLIQLACSIFWFNPLIWLYRKEVRQNLEYIADYKTQEESNSEIEYQRLLLKTSVTNHNISLPNNFYNSLIKERIVMLKKSRSNRKKQWKYFLMLPLLAGLLLSMNTEEVYIESETILKESSQPTLEFVVTKNTTEAELKAMSDAIENKGGTLVFSDIIRNEKKELVNIFLKLNNHKYGYTNNTTPIDSFIIYKEFFGSGGGYVGRINGATLHFDNDTNDKNFIDALTKRAHKSIIKKGVQKSFTSESIKVTFTKMMTDESIKKHKEFLKSKGVIMTLNELKRNKNNEIIDINIDFKTENGSANYNVNDEAGIKSFYFNMEEDGSFRVGALNNQKVIVGTLIESDNLNQNQKSSPKTKVFIYDDEKHEAFPIDSLHGKVLIEQHENSVKDFKNSITIIRDTIHGKANHKDSVYIIKGQNGVKGYYSSNFSKDTIHVVRGYKTDSSHVKADYFYQSNSPVKIINSDENIIIHNPKTSNQNSFVFRNDNNPKPLYVVNGKVIKDYHLNAVNPNNIEKIHVLKGNSATELYGKKGENGVLVITTKGKNTFVSNSEIKKQNSWRVEVGGMNYIDDEDPRKNSTLAYLTKYTSDKTLENHKENLKKMGITVKFSKLKRNKAGEITSVKISISNEKGAKSSATWKVDEGIPSIEFGETEGSLIARTSNMN